MAQPASGVRSHQIRTQRPRTTNEFGLCAQIDLDWGMRYMYAVCWYMNQEHMPKPNEPKRKKKKKIEIIYFVDFVQSILFLIARALSSSASPFRSEVNQLDAEYLPFWCRRCRCSPTLVSSHHFLSDFRRRHRKHLPRISWIFCLKSDSLKKTNWASRWVGERQRVRVRRSR